MKVIVATLLFLALGVANARADHELQQKQVLLINSYHQTMTWVQDVTRGVVDVLKPAQNNLVLHVENMDTKRYPSPHYRESLRRAFRVKYHATRFDLILVSDNNAFDFMRRYRDQLFPGVPVVFCGVNDYHPEMLDGLHGFTGAAEVFDAAATLRSALKLRPQTRRVLVLNDYLKTGRAWEKTIRRQLAPLAPRLRIDYAANLGLDELQQQIADLPADSIVLLGAYFSDRDGRYVTYEEIGRFLAEHSKVPVFCLLEFNIGNGVIGGSVISGYYQGQIMAQMGHRILHGEDPAQIPVLSTGSTRYMFDYHQLQRFDIDQSDLPPGAQILNRPHDFYHENRQIILTAAGFILALLIVIGLLVLNIRKRRQAEAQLRSKQRKLRGLFDQTFGLQGLLSPNGILLDANQTALDFIGARKEDVIGLPFWDTAWWPRNQEMQQQVHDAIDRAAAGDTVRFETTHKAVDGRVHEVDFSVRPLQDEYGRIIYLIPEGRDISERKEIERALRYSEERLSTALTAANDGLWDWQIESGQTYYNPTYYTMVGYEPDEFSPSIAEFIKRIHPDDRERVKNDIDAHLAGRSSGYQSEFRFAHKNGDWRWILARGEIVEYDATGKPLRMIGIHTDITGRKENEYQLYKAQSYIRNILDSMPSMIISVDPQGRITQWNMEAEKATGTSASEARGRLLSEVMPRLQNQMEQVQIALKDRQPHRQTKVVGSEDSQARYSDITVYPLVANGVDGAVIRVDDVTERVRLEEMMIQSEKMLSVGGLAAGMAHEINNPLAGILQSSQVLLNRLRNDLPKGKKVAAELGLDFNLLQSYFAQLNFEQLLAMIHDSGVRAARIVENILNFSRKSDQSMPPHSLPKLVDKTLDLAANDFDLKSKYDFRRITIKREYADALPEVHCDETQIQQVLLNLLRNGAQAMRTVEDVRKPQFTLRLYRQGEEEVVEVEDNGPGMQPELCKRIFEPFFTTKEVGEGTGLGLSVSYFIITEHHQGSLEVESSPGTGTCFTIRLPIVHETEKHG